MKNSERIQLQVDALDAAWRASAPEHKDSLMCVLQEKRLVRDHLVKQEAPPTYHQRRPYGSKYAECGVKDDCQSVVFFASSLDKVNCKQCLREFERRNAFP